MTTKKKLIYLAIILIVLVLTNNKERVLNHLASKYAPGTLFGMPGGGLVDPSRLIDLKNFSFLYSFTIRGGHSCSIITRNGISFAGLIDFVYKNSTEHVPC